MVGRARITIAFAVAVWVSMTLALTGCGGSGTGHQRAAGTGQGLTKAKAETVKLKDLSAQTSAALKDLLNDPQRDLKPQYKTFATALSKLSALAQKTRDRNMAIQAQLDKYLDTWREQVGTIQDTSLRDKALERIAQAKESFKKLSTELSQVKESISPYVANLKDIQKYLDTDLTPAGLKAISEMATKALGYDQEINARLDGAIAEFDRVAEELTAGPQRQKAAGANP